MKQKYFTKSKFKLAMECPTKLFYSNNNNIYANKQLEDSFLIALADGGYQVGELAKYYYPGGVLITALDTETSISQTKKLLLKENVIIYEAAIKTGIFFIRTDILIKRGNNIKLIEVKSKSIDKSNKTELTLKKWNPYLEDIAFQKYVLSKAFPEYSISAHLMLADKEASCPTNFLNQKFKLIKDKKGQKKVILSSPLIKDDLSEKILVEINVDNHCENIYQKKFTIANQNLNFSEQVEFFANAYVYNKKIPCIPSTKCSKCEFRATDKEIKKDLRCGFSECWMESFSLSKQEIKEPTVLNIWNFRGKEDLINNQKIKLTDISKTDLFFGATKTTLTNGLSPKERQWLQVEKVKNKDLSYYIDKQNLKKEMAQWVYPFHFIDFETARVAIPFNKGMSPYEGIAFQFSHHIVYENGEIEHKGEYINLTPGQFPNYNFIRELKKQLENDNGTIFRYGSHENSFLNTILKQIQKKSLEELPDKKDLCLFIKSISKSTKNSSDKWQGERIMVDMLNLVKLYYYNPLTNGSNSLKYILPAILNSSKHLQNKYSKPIYGAINGIHSLNFKNKAWIQFDDKGMVEDPYKLLPKVFKNISDTHYKKLTSELDELNNGGIALTAYAKMQFSNVSDFEREEVRKALLRYCELDTLAMVMLYEGWKDLIDC